jgi:hypothetical protein
MVMSELLTYEYASYFENETFEQLDELAASFKLGNCLSERRTEQDHAKGR